MFSLNIPQEETERQRDGGKESEKDAERVHMRGSVRGVW